MISDKPEPDSELLSLYFKQSTKPTKNNASNNKRESIISYDYYKLIDDDVIKDKKVEDSSVTGSVNDSYQMPPIDRAKPKPLDKPLLLAKSQKNNSSSITSNNYYTNSNNSTFSNKDSNGESRKPVKFVKTTEKLPQIETNISKDLVRSDSSESQETKKLVKWNLWWDKHESNIRIPFSYIPEYKKKVVPKVGSLELVKHKPGGGNIQVVNEKPSWKKEAKIDHKFKNYKAKGGDIKILDQKIIWNTNAKVNSLDNVTYKPGGGNIQILQQPFKPTHIKPRIDTGFLYEQIIVASDYQVKPSANTETFSPRSTARSPHSFKTQNIR